MNPEAMLSLFRQVVTLVSGYFVGKGMISGADSTTLVSALVSLASVGWSIYSHFGMKKVPEAAKVVAAPGALGIAIVFALLCLEGDGGAAQAANLAPPALKAAPAIYDPIGSGGWFVGAGTQLVSSKETVANTNILSQSGSLGVIGGYGRGNGVSWWQLQGEVYWKNLDGNGFCGIGTACAVSSSFSAGAWLKVGGPITKAFLNALPQVGSLFPGLSTTTLADNVFPYLALGTAPEDVSATLGLANARAWTIPVGARAGMITKLTNGTVSDTGIEVDFAGSGFALGGAKVNPGVAYKAYLHFAIGA